MLRVIPRDDAHHELALTLDEICRRSAERMLAVALGDEVDAYLERHRDAREDAGRALVVRNGHARGRTVVAGAGATRCDLTTPAGQTQGVYWAGQTIRPVAVKNGGRLASHLVRGGRLLADHELRGGGTALRALEG